MTFIPEEPPDQNEAYENLDEALDEADLPGHGGGPEGGRDIDEDLVADRTALHEAGADLDDPDRIALLDGAMDDPDGADVAPRPPGWTGAEELDGVDREASYGDDQLEFVEVDPSDLEQVPDDAPGPDSARW